MRGRLAILLVVALTAPLVALAWWGHRELRTALSPQAAGNELALAEQTTLDSALLDLRDRLHEELDELALRVACLPSDDDAGRARAFRGVAQDQQPRWLAHVPAAAGGEELPHALAEALSEELASDVPLSGWRRLPLPDGDGLCAVVVEPLADGHFVAVQPLAPVLARLDVPDRLERAALLPDGARLPVGTRSADIAANGGLGEQGLASLWSQATADAADGDLGPAHRRLASGLLAAVPLASPQGEPVALLVARAPDVTLQPLLRQREAALARSGATVAWIAAAGVLLALVLGLLAPHVVWGGIRESTDFIFASVARLNELVGRIGVALAEQAAVLESLSASVARLGADSGEIAQTSRTLTHSAEQSEWVSQSGHQKAESAQRAVLDMREGVDEIGRQMEELGRRCEAIGEILVYVDHLTSETSAVSINATIKAAGEGGSGELSAMGAEIQKLAELALGSTREIRQLIEEIQHASGASLAAMGEGRGQVERCLSAFEEVEQNFGRILRWVEDTKRGAQGIEGRTAHQSEALRSVARDVDALGQRSRETSGNFDAVVDASNELAELGRRMNRTWRVG
jgi:hypothetical protein